MKRRVVNIFCFVLYWTGILPILFRLRFARMDQILVLLYHRIGVPRDSFDAAVTVRHFEDQMLFLRKHFKVVSVAEALEYKGRGENPDKPLAVITFDDGYRDNWEKAYPVLRKYELPATFFITTGCVGNKELLWTSKVEAMFRRSPVEILELRSLVPARVFRLRDHEGRMRACHEVKNEMKHVSDLERQEILKELETCMAWQSLPEEPESFEMLSWDEVRQMARDPLVEIGSHSVSHRMLGNLSGEDLHYELVESKRRVEEETGRPARYVSYPGNSYNEDVEGCAREAGYEAGFAVDRSLSPLGEGRYRLKRIHVEDGPLYVFQAEIALVLRSLRVLKLWLAGVTRLKRQEACHHEEIKTSA